MYIYIFIYIYEGRVAPTGVPPHRVTPHRSPAAGLCRNGRQMSREREFFIDNLLVRIHLIVEMIWWTGQKRRVAPTGVTAHQSPAAGLCRRTRI